MMPYVMAYLIQEANDDQPGNNLIKALEDGDGIVLIGDALMASSRRRMSAAHGSIT